MPHNNKMCSYKSMHPVGTKMRFVNRGKKVTRNSTCRFHLVIKPSQSALEQETDFEPAQPRPSVPFYNTDQYKILSVSHIDEQHHNGSKVRDVR